MLIPLTNRVLRCLKRSYQTLYDYFNDFAFYVFGASCAQHTIVQSDYISAVDNFTQYGVRPNVNGQFFEPIKNFHTTFQKVPPFDQHMLVKHLILRNVSFKDELVQGEAKKILQDARLQHSKLKTQYQKRLSLYADQDIMQSNDVFCDPLIRFYHQFVACSVYQEDQLYYQIKYIKKLNLPLKSKSFLIMSLVDNTQSALFSEQNKKASKDVIFKIAHYYDQTITQTLMESYFQLKENFESKRDVTDINFLQQIQIIEKQKILLMTIAFLRGFFLNSEFVLFAKHADCDCGNYCIDVFKVNTEKNMAPCIQFLFCSRMQMN